MAGWIGALRLSPIRAHSVCLSRCELGASDPEATRRARPGAPGHCWYDQWETCHDNGWWLHQGFKLSLPTKSQVHIQLADVVRVRPGVHLLVATATGSGHLRVHFVPPFVLQQTGLGVTRSTTKVAHKAGAVVHMHRQGQGARAHTHSSVDDLTGKAVVTLSPVATGASFTAVTVSDTVALAVPPWPSDTVYVKLSAPL